MKKPAKKAALYTPYLDVLGGGEKHILSILKVLEEEGYEVTLIFKTDLRMVINERFQLGFSNLQFLPYDTFKRRKLPFLAQQDVFLYVSDGSYTFSPARKNFVLAMVPKRELYPHSLMDKLKTLNTTFLANSRFTAGKLAAWGIKSTVLYPYIEDDFFKLTSKKEKLILSVGRFFSGELHTKKHELILSTFAQFKSMPTGKDYSLVLIGGVKEEDKGYVNSIKALAQKIPDTKVLVNAPYEELLRHYAKALCYWHFTGYGVDVEKHPEQLEHFGITPLEAMASACVPFCVNAGGPKEYIEHGKNGYLFSTTDELITLMHDMKPLGMNARKSAKEFNYEHFKNRVLTLL